MLYVPTARSPRSTPSPVDALPCASRSISNTCSPAAASAVARLMAVVVLPTPPFWLAIASTRGDRAATRVGSGTADSGSGIVVDRCDVADPEDARVLRRVAGNAFYPHVPPRRGRRQFGLDGCPLKKEADAVW